MLHIMKFDEVITWTFVQNLMESWFIKKRVDKNAFMALAKCRQHQNSFLINTKQFGVYFCFLELKIKDVG